LKRSTHSELREQSAAFALGVLVDDDRAEFEAHLLGCDECDDDVRAFMRVTTALASAVPPAEPDAALRQRVLDATALTSPPTRALFRGPWLLAAASLIIAIGLGAYAFSLRQRAAAAQSVVIVLGADDLVRVELAGQPAAPRASARAFWSPRRGLIFTASRLPPLPAGRTYQLWIISGQMPVGAGLLRPASDGAVQAVFPTPSGFTKAAAFAVTIEPDGGVAAPTGDKYLVGLVN
jgi:anti-sigma-K factor RskA